jgi:tetratricopeptide (TPR) repeat protein
LETTFKDDQVFIRDVYRKRAFANLTAKRFDAALDDALASSSGDASVTKSCCCAGRASYELGLFGESKAHFEKALQSNPKDLKSRKDYNRAAARIAEKEDGNYDFNLMIGSVTRNHIHLDCADFIKNTIVGKTVSHGRGLFATNFIPAGGLVHVEKALCLPNLYEGDQSPDSVLYNFNTNARTKRSAQPALFVQLANKLYNNPSLATGFFDLDSGKYLRSGEEGEVIDGVPVIDM